MIVAETPPVTFQPILRTRRCYPRISGKRFVSRLLVSATAVVASLPLAILLGWILAKRQFAGKFLVETLINLPLVLPPVVTGYLLLVVFGRQGPLGSILENTFGVRLVFDWKGAALAAAVVAFPLLIRPIRQAFAAIDDRLIQAARTLGARAAGCLSLDRAAARAARHLEWLCSGIRPQHGRIRGDDHDRRQHPRPNSHDLARNLQSARFARRCRRSTDVGARLDFDCGGGDDRRRGFGAARSAARREWWPMTRIEFQARHQYPAGFKLDAAFEAEDGVTALFGPSGSGKTTILNIIAGILRPQQGVLTLDGQTLVDTTKQIFLPPEQRHVGCVFQDHRLFPHLTIEDNLRYGLRRRPTRAVDFSRVVDVLELGELLNRYPGTTQRRSGTARCPRPRGALRPEAALDG